ncbi:hypothetical protein [Gluconobacter cerinus]|uniref:hypothetical protein n=1 Tax=Gluconobacter cerinus TaxID=38307 RepID=UPI0039ECA9AF
MIAKPTQSSKPLFNIKETGLLRYLPFQSTQKKWNHKERLKTSGFFEPSTSARRFVAVSNLDSAGAETELKVAVSISMRYP